MNNQVDDYDDEGFVALVDGYKPYWIVELEYDNDFWICYWNSNAKGWFKLRKITEEEVDIMYEYKIDREFTKIYHDLHNLSFGGAPNIKLN